MEMVESVIRRMRWKAFFFLHGGGGKEDSDEKYGLKSRKCPPVIDEMKPFEEDILRLIENLEFRRTNDKFQKRLKSDIDNYSMKTSRSTTSTHRGERTTRSTQKRRTSPTT